MRLIVAILLACHSVLAAATDAPFPSRVITLVVPAPPGGGLDLFGRIIADSLRASLGQSVVVENVGGAGGSIGAGKVARATPDGHTLVLGSASTHATNGALYRLDYDVVGDFEPVALVTVAGRVVVSRKDVPARDLRELIAWIKSRQGATAGTPGVGSIDHVAGVLFEKATGANLQHVPYRGVAPAIHDLLAGRLDLMITGITETLPHLRAGNLKAYAITASARFPSAPEIPTVDEAGLPGFHPEIWTALWAPKGTPPAVLERLGRAVREALADPGIRARFPEPAVIAPPELQTARALRARQRADIARWWPVIRAGGIKPD